MSEQIVMVGRAKDRFGFPYIISRDLIHAFRQQHVRAVEFPLHDYPKNRYLCVPGSVSHST